MTRLNSFVRAGRVVVGMSFLAALASCGGGDDDGSPSPPVSTTPTNMPPASASASVDGFIAFLKMLVATQPNNTEPLDLTGFVAPTSDTTEPDPSI